MWVQDVRLLLSASTRRVLIGSGVRVSRYEYRGIVGKLICIGEQPEGAEAQTWPIPF
jgi:hypothetical protein